MSDDLEPRRGWEELIEISRRRGRVLRRRRLAAQAGSPLGVIMIGLALLVHSGPGGDDSLRVVPTAPRPSASHVSPQPTPSAEPGPPAPDGASPADPAVQPGAAPRPSSVPSRTRPIPSPTLRVDASPGVALPDVEFADATGDGVPGGQSVPAASDPALDVTRMRFTSTGSSLRLTMTLLGPHRSDAVYFAFLTDARSGCQLQVQLGGDFRDYYFEVCNGTSTLHEMPQTADLRADLLVAELPFDAFPQSVRPSHLLSGLAGQSQIVSGAQAAQTCDAAATGRTITPEPGDRP